MPQVRAPVSPCSPAALRMPSKPHLRRLWTRSWSRRNAWPRVRTRAALSRRCDHRRLQGTLRARATSRRPLRYVQAAGREGQWLRRDVLLEPGFESRRHLLRQERRQTTAGRSAGHRGRRQQSQSRARSANARYATSAWRERAHIRREHAGGAIEFSSPTAATAIRCRCLPRAAVTGSSMDGPRSGFADESFDALAHSGIQDWAGYREHRPQETTGSSRLPGGNRRTSRHAVMHDLHSTDDNCSGALTRAK